MSTTLKEELFFGVSIRVEGEVDETGQREGSVFRGLAQQLE